jgi:hypothetical protein
MWNRGDEREGTVAWKWSGRKEDGKEEYEMRIGKTRMGKEE